MAKCPANRCEIHLERTIQDGFKWSRSVRQGGVCEDLAQRAERHYEQAQGSLDRCAMREAFDHLRDAEDAKSKVVRCIEIDPGYSGLGSDVQLSAPPKRKKMKGRKVRVRRRRMSR